MGKKDKSGLGRLWSEAAKHEENAAIIRGSMSSRPSPNDFEQAERIQRERDRAKDKRALATHLVNQRTTELEEFFKRETGCSVSHEWKIDLRNHRFYFQHENKRQWKYILDVHQDDVDENVTERIIQQLEAAQWQQVLRAHSGKSVPLFKDGKFSNPATFQQWPSK